MSMYELTKEEIKRIRDNSPYAIPLDAYANGWTQPAVRQALGHCVCGEKDSVLSVIKDKVFPYLDSLYTHLHNATTLLVRLEQRQGNIVGSYTYDEEKAQIDQFGDQMDPNDKRPLFVSGKWFNVLYLVEYDMVGDKVRGTFMQYWFKGGKVLARHRVFMLGGTLYNGYDEPKKEWTEWEDLVTKDIEQSKQEVLDQIDQKVNELKNTLPQGGIGGGASNANVEQDISSIKSRLGKVAMVVFEMERNGAETKYKKTALMAGCYYISVRIGDYSFSREITDDDRDFSFSSYDCKTNRLYYVHIKREYYGAEGYIAKTKIEELGYLDMSTMQKTTITDYSNVYVLMGKHYI